jgi:hypothetical protein
VIHWRRCYPTPPPFVRFALHSLRGGRDQLPAESVVVAAGWSSAGGSVMVESMRTNIPVCAGSSTSLPFFVQM